MSIAVREQRASCEAIAFLRSPGIRRAAACQPIPGHSSVR